VSDYKPSRRDVNTAIGMFMAMRLIRDLREQGKTVVDILTEGVGLDDAHVAMMFDVADNHAESLQAAVEEAEQIWPDKVPTTERGRDSAAKVAFVMAALSEGVLAQTGRTFEDTQFNKDDEYTVNIRKATDNLDPVMMGHVAEMIVKESFPDEHPVKDVLAALWLEGFMVGIMSEVLLEVGMEEPGMKEVFEAAEKTFGGHYT